MTDLVKRERGKTIRSLLIQKQALLARIEALEADQKSLRLHIADLTTELDINVAALEAAAAQPEREAALVKALVASADAMELIGLKYDIVQPLWNIYKEHGKTIAEARETRAAYTPAKDERAPGGRGSEAP